MTVAEWFETKGEIPAAAKRFANAGQAVHDRFLHWIFSRELSQYPTSRTIAGLYEERLAGREPPPVHWQEAEEDAARIFNCYRDNGTATARAALAASTSRNLFAVLQACARGAMDGCTTADTAQAAIDALIARFLVKATELTTGAQ